MDFYNIFIVIIYTKMFFRVSSGDQGPDPTIKVRNSSIKKRIHFWNLISIISLKLLFQIKDVIAGHHGLAEYTLTVTPEVADGSATSFAPFLEKNFVTDSSENIVLDLEPGSSYRACVTNIRFDHEECQVRKRNAI
jgi:hypothetical protein